MNLNKMTTPNEHKKKKQFLNRPKYPGGKSALREFIAKNLQYPKEAVENKIEGTVYLNISVSDQGQVVDAKVKKGIGYGCDEESIRLAKLLKYEKVKNRGVRLVSSMRLNIHFKLKKHAKTKITYTVKKEKPKQEGNKPTSVSYSYTIKL